MVVHCLSIDRFTDDDKAYIKVVDLGFKFPISALAEVIHMYLCSVCYLNVELFTSLY